MIDRLLCIILRPVNIAISLANTAGADGDRLATPARFVSWLEAEFEGRGAWEVVLRAREFRSLRETIRELLTAAVERRPLPREAVDRLNRTSAAVPAHLALDPNGPTGPRAVEMPASGSATAGLLATIARSAIGLLAADARDRPRRCPAARCGRFFLTARPGQVWCSPACGNRARVARHSARKRARPGGGAGPAQPVSSASSSPNAVT